MTRLEANRELVNHLKNLIEQYPDMRFSQILSNFNFVLPKAVHYPSIYTGFFFTEIQWTNEFYLESEDLLKRVKKDEH